MPSISPTNSIHLGEGHTPLIRSRAIGPEMGLPHLYFKLENLNPSGSYKDRFAARLINDMLAKGQKTCIATSSGNTGAALSAYCAAAGIRCIVIVVDGAPQPKLKQMQLYGAELLMIQDFGKSAGVTEQVFQELAKINAKADLPLPISAYKFCAVGMEGVETISHELMEQLEDEIEIFVPAGGGGLTLAVARGVLSKQRQAKVHCVQPEGNDTIASSLRKGYPAVAVPRSSTSISGLQVANVLDGQEVITTCRQLGGTGYTVEDEAVYQCHRNLAIKEGIFSEPAGAVALAGLEKAILLGEIDPDKKYVCLVTGSGFKDMETVDRNFALPAVRPISPDEALSRLHQFSPG